MKFFVQLLLILFLGQKSLPSCEEKNQGYPLPTSVIESCVDALLGEAEEFLARGHFEEALCRVDQAGQLLFDVEDEGGYREFRMLCNRALALSCLAGESGESYSAIEEAEEALRRKRCIESEEGEGSSHEEPVLALDPALDPALSDKPPFFSKAECEETVEHIQELVLLGLLKLRLHPTAVVTVDFFIHKLASEAKKCCTEEGFWKSCMQPLLNSLKWAWQPVEPIDHYRVAPDPYWD